MVLVVLLPLAWLCWGLGEDGLPSLHTDADAMLRCAPAFIPFSHQHSATRSIRESCILQAPFSALIPSFSEQPLPRQHRRPH